MIAYFDWLLRSRRFVFAVLIALFAAGIYAVTSISIDAVPDITNVQVVVNTKTETLDSENVELLVTRPIELALAGLEKMTELRSISKVGLSQVTVVFKDHTDIYWARNQVAERLSSVRSEIRYPIELGPISTGLGEVFMYAVEYDDNNHSSPLANMPESERLMALREVQDFIVRPQLQKIRGVADVDSNGGYKKEVHINFDSKKLEAMGLNAQSLADRLSGVGLASSGGLLMSSKEQLIVKLDSQTNNLDALMQMPLGRNIGGRAIKVRDVAQVRFDPAVRIGAATLNGREAVLGTVLMRVGENARRVALDVQNALAQIELPAGVFIKTLYSRQYLVDSTIKTVAKNLIEGAGLVILVLLVALGEWQLSLIAASVIPLSMLLCFISMRFFGVSANLMSLGALDFGLLVDGAIVMSELYVVKRSQANGLSRSELVDQFAVAAKPVLVGLGLIAIVYLPILGLNGVEGKLFQPMALTLVSALVASLFLSFTWVPLCLAFCNQRSFRSFDLTEKIFNKLNNKYILILEYTFKKSKTIVFALFLLVVSSVILFLRLGADFVPVLNEGHLVVGMARDPKISLEESLRQQVASEQLLKQNTAVKEVFSRLGTPESATDPMGVHLSDTFITLDKNIAESREKKDAWFSGIKSVLEEVGAQEVSQTQPIEMRFNEMLEGSRADITIKFFGPNAETLTHLLETSEALLQPIPGIESVETDPLTSLKMSSVLSVVPRLDVMNRYGVPLHQLYDAVKLSLTGQIVGEYLTQGRIFPIRLHLDESFVRSPEELKAIRVPLADDHTSTLRLESLATISVTDSVTTIARFFGERYSALSLSVVGSSLNSVVRDAKKILADKLPLPEGYRSEFGGQFKNYTHARLQLLIVVPLILVILYLILSHVFQSWIASLLIFMSLPMAMVGGVYFLYFFNINLSVSSGIGFIALIGIALLNTVVLMSELLNQKDWLSADAVAFQKLVQRVAQHRMRPVLMTALVASMGFVPMMFAHGLGSEVQRPLATVVVGGVLTSTLLTLVVLPIALVRFRLALQRSFKVVGTK